MIEMGEAHDQWQPMATTFYMYVEDVDARFKQAVAAGVTVERPLADQFYGDRSATVIDPFGHKWTIATHKVDVSMAELQKHMGS